MKRRTVKIVYYLVVLIASVIVSSVTISAQAYSIREEAPGSGKAGWEYYSSPLNPYNSYGTGNCTWYAFGRAYEVLGSYPSLRFSGVNADGWFGKAQAAGVYQTGSVAKAGSIACWDHGRYSWDTTGHVLFVEAVNSDGTITYTESSYGGPYWIKDTMAAPTVGVGKFQGYIYLGVSPNPSGPPTNCNVVTDKTSYTLGENVTINAWANGMNFYTVWVELNGQPVFSNFNQNTGAVSFTPTVEGQYTVHAACCADWNNYSEALYYFVVVEPTLDVNFFVNGTNVAALDGIGTIQVYIDGNLQTDNGVSAFTDFCRGVPAGKPYEIRVNITNPDFFFAGVDTSQPGYTGLSGTTSTGQTKVRVVICRSFGYEQAIPSGDYLIASAGTTDKTSFYLLDIEGDTNPAISGTNVSLCGPYSGNATPCEIWTVSYEDGFFTIKQKGSEIALDLESSSTIQGANVRVRQSNESNAQKWEIIPNGRDGYRIQAKCSGFSLHIVGGSALNGANVVQYANNDMAAQSWIFIPYQPTQPIRNGRYVLLSAVDPSFELDVAGDTGDLPNGANVEIWKDTAPSRYNSFDVTALNNGYYSIIHAASGCC